jgi:hypothetical protein
MGELCDGQMISDKMDDDKKINNGQQQHRIACFSQHLFPYLFSHHPSPAQ